MSITNQHVLHICKVDLDIYECISIDIASDEVIITDKQFEHIRHSHPEIGSINLLSIGDALLNPDYIFRDNKNPNTGIVVKHLRNPNQNNILVVMRVATFVDTGLLNSVISSWTISEKKLNNYIRNKELLYKREDME